MKKTIILLAVVLLTASVWAQSPQKMSYQAVIRDAGNTLVTSTTVGMQISILQTTSTGTAVYVETQTPTTNANGLVSIEIGGGTVVSGTFSTIDWSSGPYFIKTETDLAGGTTYTITGTSQLLSVPYALSSADNLWKLNGNDAISKVPQVGIGTSSSDNSSVLDISSSSQGILIPRLLYNQKITISNPATSLLVYQTDGDSGFYYNAGTPTVPKWQKLGKEPSLTGNQQAFISSFHTFTVPSGITHLYFEMAGAGGGCGGTYEGSSTFWGGGGGGGGGFISGYLNVVPGELLRIDVGARGINGTNGLTPTNGTSGGATLISNNQNTLNYLIAYGGGGGNAGTSSLSGSGGSGGNSSIYDTSKVKGLKPISSYTNGNNGHGLSTTNTFFSNHLIGSEGWPANMGKFNSYINSFDTTILPGPSLQTLNAKKPIYAIGSGDGSQNAGGGYVVLYW